MKSMLVLFTCMAILTACKKDAIKDATGAVIMPPVVGGGIDTAAVIRYRGTFTDGTYGSASGVVKIYELGGKYTLELDSFIVNSGPDLHVYLSKEVQPLTFIDLGKLRTNRGKQVYDIASKPDFTKFRYALIHCQQFNHLFGSANLVK